MEEKNHIFKELRFCVLKIMWYAISDMLKPRDANLYLVLIYFGLYDRVYYL